MGEACRPRNVLTSSLQRIIYFGVEIEANECCRDQCDRMAIIPLTHWPFTAMTICPVGCQSWCKSLPNTKQAIQKIAQRLKNLPKGRNSAKSGHTGRDAS